MPKSSVEKISQYILFFENEFDLSNKKIFNIPFWQMTRMRVYYQLAKHLNVLENPHPFNRNLKWKIKFFIGVVSASISNIFKIKKLLNAETLIVEHPRTKLVNGSFIDIYSYYYALENKIKGSNVLILSRTLNGHCEKNDGFSRISLDLAETLRVLSSKIFSFTIPVSCSNKYDKTLIEDLALRKSFKVSKLIKIGVVEFITSFILYRILFLLTINAKELVLIDGYSSRAGMIAAAKKSGIKVIEIQHGVLGKFHMGYSYSKSYNTSLLPNELLVWSIFWKNSLQNVWFPKVKIYGYQYLENQKLLLRNSFKKEKNSVIILSQGAISKQLSHVIFKNLNKFQDYKVYYKLHPSEYDTWRDNKTLVSLSNKNNFTVVKQTNLYELFSKCEYQVGVFSTALHEGIAFDCKTILVNLPGVEYMKNFPDFVWLNKWEQTKNLDLPINETTPK